MYSEHLDRAQDQNPIAVSAGVFAGRDELSRTGVGKWKTSDGSELPSGCVIPARLSASCELRHIDRHAANIRDVCDHQFPVGGRAESS